MRTRRLILLVAVAVALAAGAHHLRARAVSAQAEAERGEALTQAAEARRALETTQKRIATAQREIEVTRHAREKAEEKKAAKMAGTAPKAATSAASKPPPARESPELRQLRVEVQVSELRRRFSGVMNRAGFSTEERRRFDAINAAYQTTMLDDTLDRATKQTAAPWREAQIKELFGPARYEMLAEAVRLDTPRAIVDEIVQHTFQGAGRLNPAQATELTQIVHRHRLPGAKMPGPFYDWDGIAAEGRGVLADPQVDYFVTAIDYFRAKEEMSAISSPQK